MAGTEPTPTGRRRSSRGRRINPDAARRRASGFASALGLTSLSAIVPGAGYIYSRRRILGVSVLVISLICVIAAVWYLPKNVHDALIFAVDPARLKVAAIILAIVLIAWMAVVISTWVLLRPTNTPVVADLARVDLCRRRLHCRCSAGLARGPRSDDRGRPRHRRLRAQRDSHHSRRRNPRRPVGRTRSRQRLAAWRRRWTEARRHSHRLDDLGVDRHPYRQGSHLQPAAQHDVRALPTVEPTAQALSRRVQGRG